MWQSVPIDACLVNSDSGFLQQVNTVRNGQLSLTVELFNILVVTLMLSIILDTIMMMAYPSPYSTTLLEAVHICL